MRLIDTHCHIDLPKFDDDRDDMLTRAAEACVTDMLLIAFEPERWRTSLRLADQHDNLRVAVGLHPTDADQYTDELLKQIGELAQRNEVVAIGETGIDLYWDTSTLEIQKASFRAQVGLARELDIPFIVHQREAEAEVLEVLETFQPPINGVVHCFTGDWAYARRILDLGMHIGLGGAITFKSRKELHEAAQQIPLDRIVIETDSPFMAPAPFRGKRNEPAYIAQIAQRLAELRESDLETIAKATTINAMHLFTGLGTH